jgi:hypothetical protein
MESHAVTTGTFCAKAEREVGELFRGGSFTISAEGHARREGSGVICHECVVAAVDALHGRDSSLSVVSGPARCDLCLRDPAAAGYADSRLLKGGDGIICA